MPFQTTWSDDRTERLKVLWADGNSCSQIASLLGSVTRNGVIGKLHRLGLSSPKQNKYDAYVVGSIREHKPKGEPKKRIRIQYANGNSNSMRVTQAIEFEQFKLRCVEIVPRHLSLMDLGKEDCKYPYGGDNGEPITFCGHGPKHQGSNYCAPHFHLCRQAPRISAGALVKYGVFIDRVTA